MADSNHSRRADYTDFSDNDPFAELTRIMGHDPRAAEPVAVAEAPEAMADDDFGIDLEQELMSELDFSEFDEPQEAAASQPEADWRMPVEAAADEPEFSEIEVDHSVEDLAASIMDSFEADEAELHPAADAPATMLAVDMGDEDMGDDDMGDHEPAAAPQPHVANWDVAGEPADEIDALPDDEPQAVIEEAVAEPAEGFSMAYDEPQPVAEIAPAPSLEDELSALLAADADEPVAEVSFDPRPVTAATEPEWRPAVNTFGRANFSAPRADAPYAQMQSAPESFSAMEAELEPISFDEAPGWDEPDDMQAGAAAADATGSIAPEQPAAVEEDAFTSIFSQALALDGTDASSGHTAADYDEVLSHFSIAPPPEPADEPQQQPDAPVIDTVDVVEAAYALSDDLDIPEIDYEAPAPQASLYDDLTDDFTRAFEAEPEQPAEAPARPVAAPMAPSIAPMPAAAAWNPATPYAQAPAGQPHSPADAYAAGEGEWQEGEWQGGDVGLDDDFAFDDDFDQALAGAATAGEGAREETRSRRGLIIAAAVAGVAVFGGLGVLGMSLFGGGSDTPAMVRADSEPMKVRPENPGGTVVPNQNSEAYNRVSGAAAAAPEQERLITTAEEPVDIVAETAPAPSLPLGISEDDENVAFAETDPAATSSAAAQPKSEDRIEPAAQEPEGVGAAGDLLTVTPRKVRTMVVRPDGTMVPREMPSPEEETVVAAAPMAPSALGQVAIPTIDQAAPLTQDDAAEPSVATPPTVSVVPSQRSEPQAAPAAPQPVTQTPAATPVSAPAAAVTAATSEWSMQIASQPTAEGAQSA